MPVVEGTEYGFRAWKSNIRGVDLNRNFSVNWENTIHDHGNDSARFRGAFPFSEPETRAILRVIRANEFLAYISFHAQGEELYWSRNTPLALRLAERAARETGFGMLCGSAEAGEPGRRRNAAPTARDGADPEARDGGSFLEYVEANGRSPFLTVELCPYVGPFPYPDTDFDRVWAPAGNICLMAADALTNFSIVIPGLSNNPKNDE
jgi:g-D-glutamyl-meso-diaminopimelate peptidase